MHSTSLVPLMALLSLSAAAPAPPPEARGFPVFTPTIPHLPTLTPTIPHFPTFMPTFPPLWPPGCDPRICDPPQPQFDPTSLINAGELEVVDPVKFGLAATRGGVIEGNGKRGIGDGGIVDALLCLVAAPFTCWKDIGPVKMDA